MHNFWLLIGLGSLILWAGLLPAVSGLWPWLLIPALLTMAPITFVGGLQTVLFVVSIIGILGGLA